MLFLFSETQNRNNALISNLMIKTILKYFGFTFIFLIALIILLPIIFKGKIVDIVKEEANNNLNAKVDFGDFDLSLITTFPNFEFSIQLFDLILYS